ncbi:MAG TPA: acylphosphatase [Candidatus Paceibacterota bacterium]|nr:acylphosphatase [Candidatus Paceibacterota bacterium]
MKNLTLKIYGDVQGVGYRISAYWIARKLHVGGFVMNEPDGSVYIESEGEEEALHKFLEWCKKGPITAKVERVEVAWSAAHGKFTGFRIA